MNDVQPGADQGNPRPKKARTTESQEDHHIESVEKPPVPPEDTIMAVSNSGVIHVTNEDHFTVQNVRGALSPITSNSLLPQSHILIEFLTLLTITGRSPYHSLYLYVNRWLPG